MAEHIDVNTWLNTHDIATVRIEGTNLDSALMGKIITAQKFRGGVETGFGFADLAFGVDLGNIPHWGFAWPSWRGDMPDIFLKPDPATLVEWRRGHAAVIGDYYDRHGAPLPVCPRNLLKKVTNRLADQGFTAKVAIEIEATVFEESIYEARAKGFKNLTPLGGKAGFAYHLPKDQQWHAYMTAVSNRLDDLGIAWEAWNDEAAWGQVELNLGVTDPIQACDNWTRTRQVMREVGFQLGRTVTFMAKWCDEYGQASHLNVSLARDGDNAFYAPDGPSETMTHFIGGVMDSITAATSLALPWITSYRRLNDLDGPPTTATWGISNKTTALRAVVGDRKQSRIEYRVPGADSNAYLVLATLLAAGAHGVAEHITPPPAFDGMAYCFPPGAADRLPDTISKAFNELDRATTLRQLLGDELIDYWIGMRRWEWMRYHGDGGTPESDITDWEINRYFELV
ncbi:glutamine synthetase [Mycolicibacterium wolinskyi]|uniref:Glutamine synthetase n=1 Tax=Mycolicibacterium wolinskyi TaxID=59750 RepID=A0A1X2F323_9MYCO|nr:MULTISPECIES: glutamine synthetase family protein [Mycolicibacterium]MCV7287812.1 glutamine synthetase [Mycolicibacterium wolinskyi]MCV7294710.1 glutamine synthetase [Mycolicibacterium goodii]ORX12429.1 glutamine synthetase [Mycolicibacterium wolinskyi]